VTLTKISLAIAGKNLAATSPTHGLKRSQKIKSETLEKDRLDDPYLDDVEQKKDNDHRKWYSEHP
jgi:hypothetical protein